MYLSIDLSQKDQILLQLFDDNTLEKRNVSGLNRDLLAAVADFLQAQDLRPLDIHGIVVVVGSGSFTSTRLATTVANAFAFVLHIPLLAITVADTLDPRALIPRLLAQPPEQYISATYSGEPNIRLKV